MLLKKSLLSNALVGQNFKLRATFGDNQPNIRIEIYIYMYLLNILMNTIARCQPNRENGCMTFKAVVA